MWGDDDGEWVRHKDAATRISSLEEENRRLREALKGIANVAQIMPDGSIYLPRSSAADPFEPLATALRRAREAMTDSPSS